MQWNQEFSSPVQDLQGKSQETDNIFATCESSNLLVGR